MVLSYSPDRALVCGQVLGLSAFTVPLLPEPLILITLPIFARRTWALTALRLGDDKAASFGINVRSLRFQTLIMVSLLAAFPVAFVGTIGFMGSFAGEGEILR